MKAGRFVELVLRKLSALSVGESASPEDYADAKELIDSCMDSMRADGLLWWAVKVDDVAFTGATAARPADCAVCVYASWNGKPVRLIERVEYERIEDKTQAGDPEMVLDDLTDLTLWPVPSSGNLRLTYQLEIIPSTQGQEMDMPRALVMPMIDYAAFSIMAFFAPPMEVQNKIKEDGARAFLQIRSLTRQTAETGPVETEYF
jgi:hypothetical protein